MPSKKVFALVEDDFEYNGEVFTTTAGHHVRNIFVNKRDAEEALRQLTLDRLTDLDFQQYCYDVEELLGDHATPESFCEDANKKFGSKVTFSPESLMDDLTVAIRQLNPDEQFVLLRMLRFSFGTVVETELHS
jgi:hypothetical protein